MFVELNDTSLQGPRPCLMSGNPSVRSMILMHTRGNVQFHVAYRNLPEALIPPAHGIQCVILMKANIGITMCSFQSTFIHTGNSCWVHTRTGTVLVGGTECEKTVRVSLHGVVTLLEETEDCGIIQQVGLGSNETSLSPCYKWGNHGRVRYIPNIVAETQAWVICLRVTLLDSGAFGKNCHIQDTWSFPRGKQRSSLRCRPCRTLLKHEIYSWKGPWGSIWFNWFILQVRKWRSREMKWLSFR